MRKKHLQFPKLILAIDPGDVQSAYSVIDYDYKIYDKGLISNEELLSNIKTGVINFDILAIEMVASYGMPVEIGRASCRERV